MITLEDAWDRLLGSIDALDAEQIAVDKAGGRYLREPLIARRTQPYADLSAMDGFAACGEGPWDMVGEARAGHAFDGALRTAQAVAISTGAALPEGADRETDGALPGETHEERPVFLRKPHRGDLGFPAEARAAGGAARLPLPGGRNLC